MLSLARAAFRSTPYPIGAATQVFDDVVYLDMCRRYPDEQLFAHLTGKYEKFSLSEVNNPKGYAEVIASCQVWTVFHRYVKSPGFLGEVSFALARAGLAPLKDGHFKSRFEFSSLPANGGGIWPHRDIPSKVVTLIVPMMQPGKWDPAWGGGTDVLTPHPALALPPRDYKTPRMDFDLACSYPCDPNQAVLFIKSETSWHSVGPIQGPKGIWRRTLTINIERAA